jgi:5-methylthioadenosine/S-adenosylhomocysteine deaminase
MATVLVRGKAVVKRVADDGTPVIVDNGAVLVRDSLIAEVGDYDDLCKKHPSVNVIGTPAHVISPGFVNAHHHVGITPLQMGIPDLPLELWIVRRAAARAVNPYLDTLYSAFELIASGVTTVQHLHGRVAQPKSNALNAAGTVIRAYQDIGMRVSYSFGMRDQNRIVYEDDNVFLARLPKDLADAARPYIAAQTFTLDENIDVFESLASLYRDTPRVKVQLAPVNLHWCSDTAITRIAELSRKYQTPMHMHLLETPIQKEYAARRTRAGAVKHLHALGALGPLMTLGHGVWATESDIELLAETGTCVCHNCSSNMRLRSGVAPINTYRKHKVCVALGIDEAGINDDRDFLQEMRLVLRMHRTPGLDPNDVPSAAEVFRMGTENGARTTPFAAQVGVLDVGKAADLVMFNWDRVSYPYLSSDMPLLDALVSRAARETIDHVMIDGQIVYSDGQFTRVDRKAVLAELHAELNRPLTAAEQQNRAMGAALFEHAQKFYHNYLNNPA